MHFTTLESLRNESDVEQKLMFSLLTALHPDGLGYSKGEVFTKSNLKHLVIEKGKNESDKVYRPDYVVLLLGLPVLIVEVKAPGLDLVKALREARLYAAELNSF